MLRTASRSSIARATPRVSDEAKLSFTEFLISSVDVEICAQRGLDWLARHAGVQRSVCGIVDADGIRLVGVAERGTTAAAVGEFSLDLDDRDHPLRRVMAGTEPVYFGPQVEFDSPIGDGPFFAVPLRGEERARGLADGLLLIGAPLAGLGADIKWFVEIFGYQVSRLRTRQALAESRAGRERPLLYDTLDAVTDPILITDPDGKLLLANARAEKLFAAPEEASEGWRHAVAVNNMLFTAALASSMMEHEAVRRELLLVDPIEGTDLLFELMSTPAKDARRGTAVVSILRNVTDLDRARAEIEDSYRQLRASQAEVRAERERLDLIIDSVADPIVVADANGDIAMMNAPAEKLFTTELGEEEQRRVRANGAHFTSFVSNLLFLGTDQSYSGSIALTDPATGDQKPVEAVAGKILSEQGELTHVVTILHDLTERLERERLYEQLKQASEELEAKVQSATAELARQNELLRRQHLQLEQASQLKSQFLANMSHEFRTPLNVILGYTHMLLQETMGRLPASQRRSLSRVDSNARHLLALINDILDITRIEAGRLPVNITRFKVADLVHEVTTELEPLVKQSKLAVTTDIPARFPLLETDRQKVKQIALNLLSNALKFTPRGSVTIRARFAPAPRLVSIAFSDTGIGIPEADQERVFEDFQQLDPTPTRAHGGTGLGLAICRRLANMLEGRILLQSHLGRGSTFTLQLPQRLRRR